MECKMEIVAHPASHNRMVSPSYEPSCAPSTRTHSHERHRSSDNPPIHTRTSSAVAQCDRHEYASPARPCSPDSLLDIRATGKQSPARCGRRPGCRSPVRAATWVHYPTSPPRWYRRQRRTAPSTDRLVRRSSAASRAAWRWLVRGSRHGLRT